MDPAKLDRNQIFVAPASRRRFCEMWSTEKSPARCRRHILHTSSWNERNNESRGGDSSPHCWRGTGRPHASTRPGLARRALHADRAQHNHDSTSEDGALQRPHDGNLSSPGHLRTRARCGPASRSADGCFSGALHGGSSPRPFAVPIGSGGHR